MTMYRTHGMAKRRVVLSCAATYCAAQAYTYLPPPFHGQPVQEPVRLATANHPALLAIYMTMWICAGVFCLANLKVGRLVWPLAIVCGLVSMWGASFVFGWFTSTDHPEWLLTGITYLARAGVIGALVVLTPHHPAPPDQRNHA